MKGHVYGAIAVILIFFVLLTGLRSTAQFRLGIENIPQKFAAFLKKKTAVLISDLSAIGRDGRRSVDILLSSGITIKKNFTPKEDASSIADGLAESVDKLTGIPSANIYGRQSIELVSSDLLSDIDVILFDLPISGMCSDAYVSTMLCIMKTAQQSGKMFVVFDRPNPLGNLIEGPLVTSQNRKAFTALPVPIRHGLTVGELAWYCNMNVLRHPANLVVVKMAHYKREKDRDAINISLSSDLRGKEKQNSGDILFRSLKEVDPLYIFSCNGATAIMLPSHKGVSRSSWLSFGRRLEQSSIQSTYHQCYYDGCDYSGLLLSINNVSHVSMLTTFFDLINFCKNQNIALSFSEHFDSVVGLSGFKSILQGHSSIDALAKQMYGSVNNFYVAARTAFMYAPFPQVGN